jgi:hypothetical protein
MRAFSVSRVVAAILALTVAGACSDQGPIDEEPSRPDATMLLAPTSLTIDAGETVALQAMLLGRDGLPLQGVTIHWASTNSAVASVSSRGEVFGRRAGQAVIIASASGQVQRASVRVLGRGPKQELLPNMDPVRRGR